ncbi:hypothetical protein [Nocardioides pelophilus]|uniref:hypothetical protein n=1 Tax=Nocardioides pelophilus TaxID=2172019 RepID=UPI001602CB35|nr:hypothetical protein [Nocardioides pelophilus]
MSNFPMEDNVATLATPLRLAAVIAFMIGLAPHLAATPLGSSAWTSASSTALAKRACRPPMYGPDFDNLWVRNMRCRTGRKIIRKAVDKANTGKREFRVECFRCTARYGVDLITCTRGRKWVHFNIVE